MPEDEITRVTSPVDEPYDMIRQNGYWLEESYCLRLTSLELGWLVAMVYTLRDVEAGEVMEPDENGNPVPTTLKSRITKKLIKLVEQSYKEAKDETRG